MTFPFKRPVLSINEQTSNTAKKPFAYNGVAVPLTHEPKGVDPYMMRMVPFTLENGETVLGVEVKLPKTTLLAIMTDKGYIMCGALDVTLLNERLKDREILAGRAVGVRTLEELMAAPLESVTHTAEANGIIVGMKGSEALQLML
jgi:uncharacterized protein YunC (DUF1805 family)